jgi:dsDNA-specific endonuclease/ATPase MutS2
MTVQKGKAKNKTKKASTPKISEKIVIEAMTALENLAKEYISQAKDEIKTGRKIADKIRDIADNIENELVLEGINMTEAYDSKDFVGVGIGVL